MIYIIPVIGAALYFLSIVRDPNENKDKWAGGLFGALLLLITGEVVILALMSAR